MITRLLALVLFVLLAPAAHAQNAPTRQELAVYAGLHEAAAKGDVAEIERLIKDGEKPNIQDSKSRTPLHVAAYMKQHAAARALLKLGADPNRLEIDRYDIVTIAAVANDLEMLKIALEGGGSARNITSRYDGTALIAAAHLGHAEAVKLLIAAKANGIPCVGPYGNDRNWECRQGQRRVGAHARSPARANQRAEQMFRIREQPALPPVLVARAV